MKIVMVDASRLAWLYSHFLCEALAAKDHEVHLVTTRFLYADAQPAQSYIEWDHFYHRTNRLYGDRAQAPLRQYVKGLEHVIDMVRVGGLLRRVQPDVIHFQQAPVPWVDGWFLESLKRVAPVVSTVHNTTPFHGDAPWIQRRGFRFLIRRFDHVIVHTNYSRRCLVGELGVPDERISEVRGGVYDFYQRIPGTPERSHVKPSEDVVLFFGNLSYYKGPDLMLEAFARLPASRRDRTRLLMAGNPKMPAKTLKQLASDLGIADRVEWDLRFIPDDEVDAIFSRATVVALPYRHIERSGVLTTALSYGKPIVANRIGGFAEMLEDGVQGFLVDPKNPSEMAARLDDVLADTDRARQMGKAALELARNWCSWDETAGQMVDIYSRVR